MLIDVDMMCDEYSKAATDFSQSLQEMRDQEHIYGFTVEQRNHDEWSESEAIWYDYYTSCSRKLHDLKQSVRQYSRSRYHACGSRYGYGLDKQDFILM